MNITTANFVEEFTQVLEDEGDMFFSSGDDQFDMDGIKNTIKAQGYWAGGFVRYYFDMELLEKNTIKLLSTEQRRFGV